MVCRRSYTTLQRTRLKQHLPETNSAWQRVKYVIDQSIKFNAAAVLAPAMMKTTRMSLPLLAMTKHSITHWPPPCGIVYSRVVAAFDASSRLELPTGCSSYLQPMNLAMHSGQMRSPFGFLKPLILRCRHLRCQDQLHSSQQRTSPASSHSRQVNMFSKPALFFGAACVRSRSGRRKRHACSIGMI